MTTTPAATSEPSVSRRRLFVFGSGAALAGGALLAATAAPVAAGAQEPADVNSTWLVRELFDHRDPDVLLVTFAPAGVALVTGAPMELDAEAIAVGGAFRSDGQGLWQQLADRRVAAAMHRVVYSATGAFVALKRTRFTFVLDADRDSATGVFRTETVTPDGARLSMRTGALAATRLAAEPTQ